MKLFLCSFLMVASVCVQGQKIEKFYDYHWKKTNPGINARYYSVMEFKDSIWRAATYYLYEKSLQMTGSYKDSSEQIRHGEFTWFYPNGSLMKKGRFENDRQVGIWVSYHNNGYMSDSAFYVEGRKKGTTFSWFSNGYMSDSVVYNADGSSINIQWFEDGTPSSAGRLNSHGKMVGKWQFFHTNGNLSAIEKYDNGFLLTREYYDETGARQSDTTDRDHECQFPGGNEAWSKFLSKHIYWPATMKFQDPGAAVVLIDFTVDENGKVRDAHVILPLHPDFDKIALNAIKQSPKWMPAVSHNRRVREYRTQPITFVQQ